MQVYKYFLSPDFEKKICGKIKNLFNFSFRISLINRKLKGTKNDDKGHTIERG